MRAGVGVRRQAIHLQCFCAKRGPVVQIKNRNLIFDQLQIFEQVHVMINFFIVTSCFFVRKVEL